VKSYRKMLFDVIRPSVINPLTKRKFIVRNRQSRLNNNEKIMMNYCNNSGLGLEIVRGKKSGK
jgi:nitrous oxidase accessory protein NosD